MNPKLMIKINQIKNKPEKEEEQRTQEGGPADNRDIFVTEYQPVDVYDPTGVGQVQRPWFVTPGGARDGPEYKAEPDRQHQYGKMRLSDHRPDQDSFSEGPDNGHGQDGSRQCDVKRQFEQVEIAVGEKGAQHHQVTLRKINHLGCLVDQDKPEGNQAIDAPLGDATDQ